MGFTELPSARAAQHVKAFERLGWSEKRRKGSHIMMCKPGARATLTIPDHGKEVSRSVLGRLIVAADITVEQYLEAFDPKRTR